MIFRKCRYEIIAVVVIRLTAQRQSKLRPRASALQKFGATLLGRELIGIAVLDWELGKPCAVLDESDGIVSAPSHGFVAGIASNALILQGT